MNSPENPSTVLITGASSGIGAALVPRFARAGHRLVLVARRADRLQELARALAREHAVSGVVLAADLAQAGAAAALVAGLRRRRLAIDILVNNAGVPEHGAFVRMNADRPQHPGSLSTLAGALPTASAAGRDGNPLAGKISRRGRGCALRSLLSPGAGRGAAGVPAVPPAGRW